SQCYRPHRPLHAFPTRRSSELDDALRDASDPVTRIGARLLLVDLAGQDMSGTGPIVDAALQEAQESGVLTARVRLCRVRKAFYRSEEHTSELQSLRHLVCHLLL